MKDEDMEISMKIVIVGNGVVGKSSMIQRYCKGLFSNEYKKTLGVDFLERVIRSKSETVRLMLWDTAGQEEFEALTKAYYRGAQACVIVFSTTDRDSFKSVESWKKKVEYECGEIPMALVQNKIDLINESVIKREEIDSLAKRYKWKFFKTSVKDNINVDNVFHLLAETYINSINDELECPNEELVSPHLSFYPYNSALLRTAIFPSQQTSSNNPLFNPVYGHINKYNKKANSKASNVTSHSGLSKPMINYRYKSKFSMLPVRQQTISPTILLHHQHQHRQFHYHHHNHHAAFHHKPNYHYVNPTNKHKHDNNNIFRNCRIF